MELICTQPSELYLKHIDDWRIDNQQEIPIEFIKRYGEYCALDALMKVNVLSFDELKEIDIKRWEMARKDGLNVNVDYK